jgi:hypothetical protein
LGFSREETARKSNDVNCGKLKSATLMELEQRHIVKFLHPKGFKLDHIISKLSNLYSQDVDASRSVKYWLHQLNPGEKSSEHSM